MYLQVISKTKNRIFQWNLILIAAIVVLLFWGCSAQKNTGLSRAYHNLTAKYNVLFNGTESYKDGLARIETQFTDDYSEILPVFKYKRKDVITVAASDMDRTIKKCSKLITLHSITAKPKIKSNKTLSPDERAFFNKKEYNVFVDDAYLLMAKAHFHRHEFSQASDILRRIINDFKNQFTAYESQIWLARVSIETGKNIEAADILSTLSNDENLPEKLSDDLFITYADYFLTQKNYPEAIKYLEKSAEVEKKKKVITRYRFILAQLYEKTGDLKKASEYYTDVIRMNPPYEMAFNAQINRALAYERGFGRAGEIEAELLKMLNDDKNIDYHDQIYYALGNLATKEGDEKKAVEYYEKSLEANKDNQRQKIRSYLTLANYYYSVPEYVKAQAYYDSVVSRVDADYPGYDALFSKTKSLTRLVDALNTLTLSDSLLLLAQLPQNELNNKIDAIIASERARREEERIKAQEQRLDEQFGQETAMRSALRQSTPGTSSTQWYFYNDATRNLGFREFKSKWGNRPLEDHWQRASKALIASSHGTPGETDEIAPAEENGQGTGEILSRDFYLAGIPRTDSAIQATLKNVETSLFTSGVIYKDELKDFDKANESFRQLTERFPESPWLLASYYHLYGVAKEQNNVAMTEYYKNLIAGKFPESMYAKVLTDPEYFVKIEQQEKAVQDYYAETYSLYQSGRYAEVVDRCRNAARSYPDHKLSPQFAYLGVLAYGKNQDHKVFRDSLISIVAKYPGTDIADDARNLINYMDKDHPEIRAAEEKKKSEELYRFSPPARHHFMLALTKQHNANQLVFNIINYNLDHADSLNLIVEIININNRQNLVSVKTFRDLDQAVDYMNTIMHSKEISKDMPGFNAIPFVISERNLVTLRQDKSVERYLSFYNEHYR